MAWEEKLTRDLTLTDLGILLKAIHTELRYLRTIQEDAHKLDGTTMTNVFTIPKGWGVVKVNFLATGSSGGENHVNTPRQTSFEVPGVPVQQIRLNNVGPGVLFYSTNKFMNQLEASSKLFPGETREIKTPKRAMKQINLAVQGDSCDVRLELIM